MTARTQHPRTGSRLCWTFGLLFTGLLQSLHVWASSENYPEKPLTVIVAFGVGGSADRMTRTVSGFLSEELGQPIHVVNKKGAGTLLGSRFLLDQPHDGYTLLASSFSPYLINTILEGNANYGIDDFAYLNFQWFDEDLIAVNKDAPYRDLPELLEAIRLKPKTVKASVVRGSAGHLMARLLLDSANIPRDHLNLVTYNSGGQARAAVAGGVVDFILISAQGTESIREYIRPLAIVSRNANPDWNAPTLNEALEPLGLTVPVLQGSVRGFAASRVFQETYPERFEILVKAMEAALKNEDLQAVLKQSNIGGRWVGPEESNRIMQESFSVFKDYAHLLKPGG